MQALLFHPTIPRYLAGRTLGALHRPLLWSRASPTLRFSQISDLPLPGDDWVRIAVRLGGICGSDLHAIQLDASPSLSVFASSRFVLGHESVGTIVETGPAVSDLAVGQRVTTEPLLPCAVRGLPPCASCAAGDYNRCLRFAEGRLEPGVLIGFCGSTGGSWGERYVAHRSQVLPVPERVTDEQAVLVETVACAAYPLLRTPPPGDATVLVIGGGAIGQSAIAVLRILAPRARIIALVKHPFQGVMARRLGADEVVLVRGSDGYFEPVAALTGGKLYRPLVGRRVLMGGVDYAIECVGSARSVDDALRLTRAGGTVILLGLAGLLRGVDWTAVWSKELRVLGSVYYATVPWQGTRRRVVEIVLDWMASRSLDLGALVTHRFPLSAYDQALGTAASKATAGAFKVAFDLGAPGAEPGQNRVLTR